MSPSIFFTVNRFFVFSSLFILAIYVPDVLADHDDENVRSFFHSDNGTGLLVLKAHEEANIAIPSKDLLNNELFSGHAYYNIKEGNNLVTRSENFTANQIPEVFSFSYTPQKTGIFPVTIGAVSDSGDLIRERSQNVIVVEEFSKAMRFSGQCKNPLTPFLIIKPNFSTGACVTMDTFHILKNRGWH